MFRKFVALTSVFMTSLAFSVESNELQTALDWIYRADQSIYNRNYSQAHNEVQEAQNSLYYVEQDEEIQEAQHELNQCLYDIGYNDSEARTHLNDAESLVEHKINEVNRRISKSELRETLDHIYRADRLIVDRNHTQAKREENKALDILYPYSRHDDELSDAVRYLERSLDNIGHNNSKARDELNKAETIIERRLK
jgi:hypothetical protein